MALMEIAFWKISSNVWRRNERANMQDNRAYRLGFIARMCWHSG